LFGLAAFSIWYFASGKIRVLGLSALAIVTILAIYFVPTLHQNFMLIYQNYLGYQQGDITTSAAIRIDEIKLALQVWQHHPIFGYGTSGYWWGLEYVHQTHPHDIHYIDFQTIIPYPENTFLMTLAEQGLIGFILLCGFLISMWRMSYRAGSEAFLIQGLIIAFILFSLSQATLYTHSSQTFFMVFFGVLLAKYSAQSHTKS
jgi:O-antigen ligase